MGSIERITERLCT